MIDRNNRTFICSVVYYDIANYSTKSVEVQIRLKEKLNRFTTEAIKNVAVNDRIILDTGDGAAICFLGDPEDALFVAMSLRDAVLSDADQSTDDPLLVRFGINLGPVKLVNDINNRENIIGDGINVGQRIMSFAEPGQILVSRSYFEVVSCLTQEYAKLFHYLGMRADKHIRKHEIYSIMRTSEQAKAGSPAESPQQDDAQFPDRSAIKIVETRIAPPDSPLALEQNSEKDRWRFSSVFLKHPHWWQTKKIVYGGVVVAIVLAVILSFVIYYNNVDEKIHSDKTTLSSESQLKSPDESPPESAQPTENVGPDQAVQPHSTPSVPNAIIQFAVTPWGEVYVDGKRQGASPPLTSVTVAPGKHRIEIRNTTFPPYSYTYEFKPNEKRKISHKF